MTPRSTCFFISPYRIPPKKPSNSRTWRFPEHIILPQAHARPAHELRRSRRDLLGARHRGNEVAGLPGRTSTENDGWTVDVLKWMVFLRGI